MQKVSNLFDFAPTLCLTAIIIKDHSKWQKQFPVREANY
ncbi:Uncharacterized protein dnm_019260 [Desulfonema magnum]|uniref:Uncharacterized protein n=1 Tax=Desulfonema magnum TaxID=45655 RepID=A0A975BHM8_9BACT|nr:Uncharacterized protein dnm_019260 [Desulfonema magnum]